MSQTFEQYQEDSARTLNKNVSGDEALKNYALGIGGEVGELQNLIKKFLYHGKRNQDTYHAILDEMGDVLWYLSALATAFNIQLDRVAGYNIEKLKERYPDGFKKADE